MSFVCILWVVKVHKITKKNIENIENVKKCIKWKKVPGFWPHCKGANLFITTVN